MHDLELAMVVLTLKVVSIGSLDLLLVCSDRLSWTSNPYLIDLFDLIFMTPRRLYSM